MSHAPKARRKTGKKLLIPVSCSRFREYKLSFIGPIGAGPIVYFAVIAGWLFVIVYAFTRSKIGWQIGIGGAIFVAYLVTQCVIFFWFNSKFGEEARSGHKHASDRVTK